jgi:hypothetical protein
MARLLGNAWPLVAATLALLLGSCSQSGSGALSSEERRRLRALGYLDDE